MSVALKLDFDQIRDLVAQCQPDEKLVLVRELEEQTFAMRFPRLLSRLRTDSLSMEEITAEVEQVRARRHGLRADENRR